MSAVKAQAHPPACPTLRKARVIAALNEAGDEVEREVFRNGVDPAMELAVQQVIAELRRDRGPRRPRGMRLRLRLGGRR